MWGSRQTLVFNLGSITASSLQVRGIDAKYEQLTSLHPAKQGLPRTWIWVGNWQLGISSFIIAICKRLPSNMISKWLYKDHCCRRSYFKLLNRDENSTFIMARPTATKLYRTWVIPSTNKKRWSCSRPSYDTKGSRPCSNHLLRPLER